MDVLSVILETVRLRSFVHCQNVFSAPWGFWVPQDIGDVPPTARDLMKKISDAALGPNAGAAIAEAAFFVITRGQCQLQIHGDKTVHSLSAGDLVVMPQKRRFELRDDLNSPVRPLWEILRPDHFKTGAVVEYGGGGAITNFVTGGFYFQNSDAGRLLSALPPVIHMSAAQERLAPWLGEAVKILTQETSGNQPGARAVINHMASALFVQAVRFYIAGIPGNNPSWLSALFDSQIGPALWHIHSSPQTDWTVAALADRALMSRSAFAAKFSSWVGEPPLQYLINYRMQFAATLLEDPAAGVKAVAARVGYHSESAFSNAFKKFYGAAPALYRQRQR
jgi:AraC-like DNA-binding protein